MSISKRITACILTVLMLTGVFSFTSAPAEAVITDADFVAPQITIPDSMPTPNNDLLTNNVTYYLGQGTRYEQFVKADFMAEGFKSRGTYNYQKYVVVHNTGAYPSTSTSLANHNYGKNTTVDVSWHFTCGNDGIYQMIPVNERGWHAGGNYWNSSWTTAQKEAAGWVSDCSNSSSVGIETATPGFPATDTYSGEKWDSDEMYEWYAGTFDSTATYLAELVAWLCVSMNFNPYTQVKQHYSSAAKNCPMQMRYVFGSGGSNFTFYGTYFKVMLDRMYDYYEAYGGTYISSDTVKNTYYNPSNVVYKKGLYKSSSAVTVYRAGNTATGSVGTVAANNVMDVQVVGYDWGRVVLANGTVGWVKLSGLTYVGSTYRLGTYRTSAGTVVDVTNISGTTAYYSGGSADISTLTKVYKVTVNGDTSFGSTPQYVAQGTSFTVTAAGNAEGTNFDIWDLTTGYANIADKKAKTTTVTVSGSDIVLNATYNDKYTLTIHYGTGAGQYKPGTKVDISATTRAGYAFAGWVIESGAGTFGSTAAPNTTFITTAQDTTIKAVYEAVGELDPAGLTNYALGKSYTTTWKGSSSFDYYSTAQNDSTSLKKMTDGVKASGAFATTQTNYASFIGTGGLAVFTIDLGQTRNICMAAICDVPEFGSFGNINTETDTVKVEVSTDGSNFSSVYDLTDTLLFSYSGGSAIASLYTHKLDFSPTSGRYVRISFTSSKYVMAVGELEVYGSDSIKTYPLTVDGGEGTGNFVEGKVVSIVADEPQEGYKFAGWTLVTGSGTIANPSSNMTTFTMSNEGATVKANFEPIAALKVKDEYTDQGVKIEDGVIKGVGALKSATDVNAMFEYAVQIKNTSGTVVTGDAPIGTGFTVVCNNETATVLVVGDVNSDAVINASDFVAVKAFAKNTLALEGVFATACDFDSDGNVGTADIIAISLELAN